PGQCAIRRFMLLPTDPEGRKVVRIWRFWARFRNTPRDNLKEAQPQGGHMSWLDKLLGRGKKAAGDMTGDSSMKREGMHQEQAGMASERADSAEEMAQEERKRAAEHEAQANNP